MSNFHVPVPDYDFTIRQKNPYIPTPDYTIKYSKQKSRPSLNNIGTEFAPGNEYSFVEPELPPIRVPEEVASVNKQWDQPSYQRPTKLDRVVIPKLPDENSNYPEIKKHSYIEDREEEQRHISTKEHIKQIGVPVLPGIATPVLSFQPAFEIATAPVASDQNRAFLRHLENHKKFDTVRGDRGIDDCEICQIMRKQLEAERNDIHPGYHSWEKEKHIVAQPANQHSNPGSRKKRGDVRDVFSRIEEQREPKPYFRPISARARHNFEMRQEGEISIRAMESVEILRMEHKYAMCRKSDNTVGWIPSSVFEL